MFGADESMDLPPLDRLARRLRRVVRALAAACVLCAGRVLAGVGDHLLFSSAAPQLSALHGHRLPRVSHANGVPEIPHFTVHAAILLALAGVIAHLWFPLLPWIFTLYICWSPWHYTGQNFGLLMMFARRSGLAPSSAERNAIYFSFVASFLC